MNKKYRKIAVLMGGPSAEREVSLRSGAAVAKGLKEAGYDVVEIDVKGRGVEIPAGVDAAFIVLHGEFGEDGEIQRILEAKGIPYTGSDPESSRASFDKVISKNTFVDSGVATPRYEVLRKGDNRTIGVPLVVKPARQGSSIGVHIVHSEPEWDAAVNDAFKYDSELIVEEFIEGRELTVGIVGGDVLPVVQIVAPGGDYNYKAKYTPGETKYLVPAPLDATTTSACQQEARKAFACLGCQGMGRVDIRLSKDGTPYVLELNNIPGFTETSLLPKAAAYSGLNFAALCDRIIGTI